MNNFYNIINTLYYNTIRNLNYYDTYTLTDYHKEYIINLYKEIIEELKQDNAILNAKVNNYITQLTQLKSQCVQVGERL